MKKRMVSLVVLVVVLGAIIISNVTVDAAKAAVTEDTGKTKKQMVNEADGKLTEEDFKIIIDEVEIYLKEDMNQYVSVLSEPDTVTQSKTCIGTGLEKVYTYGDTLIYAFEDGKKAFIHMFEIEGKDKTASGIGIGCTEKEVIAAYGKQYIDNDALMMYELDGMELNFYFTDGKVDFIEMRTQEE